MVKCYKEIYLGSIAPQSFSFEVRLECAPHQGAVVFDEIKTEAVINKIKHYTAR